jgi:enterochelin esterase-like enzyme
VPRFHTIEISDPIYETDGLRFVTVKSDALGRRGDVCVWAPQDERINTLLILLHGVYGSHWVWPFKAGVHRTAQRMRDSGEIFPMVIAMPSDGLENDGSGYIMSAREDVEAWIVDEVPRIARLAVPALDAQPRIVIAGLSMGGYGALRLGAKYADRFDGISAHSAITKIEQMTAFVEEPLSDYLASGSAKELSAIYWLQLHSERLPRLRFDCGVQDDLLNGNRDLHAALTSAGIPHEYAEFEGGHEWSYWREQVTRTLRFASGR